MKQILAVAFVVLSLAARAWACSCQSIDDGRSPISIGDDEAVFVGCVVETQSISLPQANGLSDEFRTGAQLVVFDVTKEWKGAPFSRVVVFADQSNCFFRFETGREYLVFARRDGDPVPGAFNVSACSLTAPITDAAGTIKRLPSTP
jgi:hypothetical protein